MTWLVILGVGLGSFVFRLGPLLALERVSLSERGHRWIRHAGTGALTALIVVSTRHAATGSSALPTVLAMAAAVVLVARGASMLRLVLYGGGVYAGAIILLGLLAR